MAKSLKLIVESLLFSSDRPLTAKEINSCLPDAKINDIKGALKVLEHEYEMMERSFKLKEVANGFQFRSRTEYAPYILMLFQTTPNRLSKATMETLAIIAYKQPILRHEIERLRGVDIGGILKTLLEKDLIRILGRKDLPGRPLIYGTTRRFLEVFDLKDISSLPKLKEVKSFDTEEYQPTQTGLKEESGQESQEETTEQDGAGEPGEEEIRGPEEAILGYSQNDQPGEEPESGNSSQGASD